MGAGQSSSDFTKTKAAVRATVFRVGILRATSALHSLDLLFQNALGDGKVSKFFKRNGKHIDLKVNGLFDALYAYTDLPYTHKESTKQLFSSQENGMFASCLTKIVHGKDLIAFVAWYFDVSLSIAGGMMKLATLSRLEGMKKQPNFSIVRNWVATA